MTPNYPETPSPPTAKVATLTGRILGNTLRLVGNSTIAAEMSRQKEQRLRASLLNEQISEIEQRRVLPTVLAVAHTRVPYLVPPDTFELMPPGLDEGTVRLASADSMYAAGFDMYKEATGFTPVSRAGAVGSFLRGTIQHAGQAVANGVRQVETGIGDAARNTIKAVQNRSAATTQGIAHAGAQLQHQTAAPAAPAPAGPPTINPVASPPAAGPAHPPAAPTGSPAQKPPAQMSAPAGTAAQSAAGTTPVASPQAQPTPLAAGGGTEAPVAAPAGGGEGGWNDIVNTAKNSWNQLKGSITPKHLMGTAAVLGAGAALLKGGQHVVNYMNGEPHPGPYTNGGLGVAQTNNQYGVPQL